MAGIDSSIYFQQQAPDIMGNIQKGLSMRDMMDQRAFQKKEMEREQQIRNAYKSGIQTGPDGQVVFDDNLTMSALAGADSKQAMDLYNARLQREKQAQQYQDQQAWKEKELARSNRQFEADQGWKEKDYGIKRDEFGLKQEELDLKKQKNSGAGRPLTKFEQAAEQERGKAYGKIQAGATKAQEQITLIDDALQTLDQYGKDTLFGTGRAAKFKNDFLGSWAPKTQNLEAKFRLINIKNMAQTFEGMSRAVDSEVERAAWESTQGNIASDDSVNKNILLGAKALSLKARAEAEAQREWVENMGAGTLRGYESPILGKTSAMVSANGEMVIVRREQEALARKSGYMGIDEYVKGPAKSNKQSQPQTIIQNGFTYTLNPKTGEYE